MRLDLFDAKTGEKIHSFESSNPITSYCPSSVISKEELQKMGIDNTIFSDIKDVTPNEEKENDYERR